MFTKHMITAAHSNFWYKIFFVYASRNMLSFFYSGIITTNEITRNELLAMIHCPSVRN